MKNRHRLMLIAALLLSVVLTGCMRWQKPGATQADFETDKTECNREGLSNYPIDYEKQQVANGYTAPIVTNCNIGVQDQGYSQNPYLYAPQTQSSDISCVTTGGQYVPPQYATIDVNQANRNDYMKICLTADGWSQHLGSGFR